MRLNLYFSDELLFHFVFHQLVFEDHFQRNWVLRESLPCKVYTPKLASAKGSAYLKVI